MAEIRPPPAPAQDPQGAPQDPAGPAAVQDDLQPAQLDQHRDIDLDKHCVRVHCSKHDSSDLWTIPTSWSLDGTCYQIKDNIKQFDQVEDVGAWAPYRCVRCRNCSQCRKGELLERVSLHEEREQHLIEEAVEQDIEQVRLIAFLPFIKDPKLALQPNRKIAEKVLFNQLKQIHASESLKESVLKKFQQVIFKWPCQISR